LGEETVLQAVYGDDFTVVAKESPHRIWQVCVANLVLSLRIPRVSRTHSASMFNFLEQELDNGQTYPLLLA
jgi:hypothetical protein